MYLGMLAHSLQAYLPRYLGMYRQSVHTYLSTYRLGIRVLRGGRIGQFVGGLSSFGAGKSSDLIFTTRANIHGWGIGDAVTQVYLLMYLL